MSREGLLTATHELQSLIRELAEVELAEMNARIEGQARSPESSASGREQDGRANARNFTEERIRLSARVEAARLRRDTIIEVLRLQD